MSTAAPVAEQNTTGALPVTTDNKTYKVYVTLDAEGKVIEKKITYREVNTDDKKEEAAETDLVKDGFQLAKTQTVIKPTFGSVEGFLEYISDAAEALAIINRGAAAKYNQKLKENLTSFQTDSQTFEVQESAEPLDSHEWLMEPTQKRALSQIEKTVKGLRLAGWGDAQIALAIKSMQESLLAATE